MKYTSQQMIQALKDGKSFWFYPISDSDLLYKATLANGGIIVEWDGQQAVYPFSNGKPTCVDSWVCTKIEGEETMTNKPHKHAELIKKWADTGCQIQYKSVRHDGWLDCHKNSPQWDTETEYRVKPTLVKKWKWVINNDGEFSVTHSLYSSPDDFFKGNPFKGKLFHVIQKIDSTMQEVEE